MIRCSGPLYALRQDDVSISMIVFETLETITSSVQCEITWQDAHGHNLESLEFVTVEKILSTAQVSAPGWDRSESGVILRFFWDG